MRERHGARPALLVGFTTYTGTVTAASDWDGPAERKRVRRALPGSYEALFHDAGARASCSTCDDGEAARACASRGSSARSASSTGPRPSAPSHYFHARLPSQFDAVIHIDETRALEPLERTAGWETGEVPDLYPWGV